MAVESVKAVDLNGDQRVDLIYTSDEGLTLVYQKSPLSSGTTPREPLWQEPEQIDLKGIRPSALALEIGDLNGDGALDIVLLRDRGFYLLTQQEAGRFHRAQKVDTSVDKLGWVGIEDLDGDHRKDLILLTTEQTDTPLVVRCSRPMEHWVLSDSVTCRPPPP